MRRSHRPISRIAIGTAVPRVNSIINGLAAGALLLALPVAAARAEDTEDCRSNDPAKIIAGCGALIENEIAREGEEVLRDIELSTK